MTGQINVEFKKPENSEKWYLNAYANSFGRMEFNANHATKLSDKWSTALLIHGNYLGNEIDGNDENEKILDADTVDIIDTIEALKIFIDTNARMDPQAMHHVYEWGKTGMASQRLFTLNHTVSNLGLSIKSDFRQSTSIKQGSLVPFYNKARIMENGKPVVIKPRNSSVLSFDVGGEQVFTKNPVNVSNPGGDWVQGSYEKTFDNLD